MQVLQPILSVLFFICLLGFPCPAADRPVLTEPGIVLTFDDSGNIFSWANRLPMFQKYGAKATLFLDKPDTLNDRQKMALKKLADAGFEIASHGLRHKNGRELIEKEGKEAFLNEEILPCIKALEELGYQQKTLGYAFNARTDEMDEMLKKYFYHVRGGGAVCDHRFETRDNLFTPVTRASSSKCVRTSGSSTS